MSNDTIQGSYKSYRDKGVSRKEYAKHLLTVGVSLVGFMWLASNLMQPLMKSVGSGLLATGAFCFGLWWLCKQFDKADPIEQKLADKKEFERLRAKLLEERNA